MNYSVLMSVYHKEKPEYLRQSMESMFAQTVPTDDFVLVCDGPLGDELNEVIAQMQDLYDELLHVVRLEVNVGLGNALNQGVLHCKNELVARMDSDDISRPDRCERELTIFEDRPEISIVGSNIEEFTSSIKQIESCRIVPESNEDIVRFAKRRNPFNHPSVMYKKSDVLGAGNYGSTRYIQDYFLWIAMLTKDYQGYNIQESLVWMRADANLFKRRSGWLYVKLQLSLLKKMLNNRFISLPQYLASSLIRICSALAPNKLRQAVFKKVLRSK